MQLFKGPVEELYDVGFYSPVGCPSLPDSLCPI